MFTSGRRGRDHALELPRRHSHLENRAGHRLRQHGRLQAGTGDRHHRRQADGMRGRSRAAPGRRQHGNRRGFGHRVKIGRKIPNISGLKFPRKSRHTLREESKYGEEWGVFCDQGNETKRDEYHPNRGRNWTRSKNDSEVATEK
jgi:hypothetical protein